MGCNCRGRRRNRDRKNAFITPLSSPKFYYGRTERASDATGRPRKKSEGNPQSHSCIALKSMNAHRCIVIICSCIAIPHNSSNVKMRSDEAAARGAIMEPLLEFPSERVKADAASTAATPPPPRRLSQPTNHPSEQPEVITIRVVRCRGGGSCAFDGFCIEGSPS